MITISEDDDGDGDGDLVVIGSGANGDITAGMVLECTTSLR